MSMDEVEPAMALARSEELEADNRTVLRCGSALMEWRRRYMIRYISKRTEDFRGEYRVNYPQDLERLLASQALFAALGPIIAERRFIPEEHMDLTPNEFFVIKGELDARAEALAQPNTA
jgi:hypothetical protein